MIAIRKTWLLIVFGSLLASCSADIEQISALDKKDDAATVIAKNSEIIYTESGHVKLKILAPETKIYQNTQDPYNEFPAGITVYTFSDSMVIESELTAKYAINYDYKGLWEASNNVIAKNSKGETLNTEHLFWDRKKKIIYSDDMVKITTSDGVQYGQGFISDESFNSWEIKKPISYYYIDEKTDSIK